MKSDREMTIKACRWLSAWMAVWLLPGIAWAQVSIISVRTLQLAAGELPDSWVMVADEKEPVKLAWLTSQPTEPLRVVLDKGKLKLFRYALGQDGKMAVDDVRVIPLPEAATEVLLLGWASDGKGKYVAIKDHFLQAKFDDWIAINTSPHPVAVRAGRKSDPVRVDPGKSVVFRPEIEEGKGVAMIAQAPYKGKLKTFLSTYWPAFAGQRTMIVFFDDGERMRAKRIGDRFVRKEEPAP
jgi:hypothetical protein